MSANDPELEFSPLSSLVERDGMTVGVQIYRFAISQDDWTLEVVDHDGGSTVWNAPFKTHALAPAAFNEVLAEEGIRSFGDAQPGNGGPTGAGAGEAPVAVAKGISP